MVVQIGRKVDSVVAGVICNNERDGVHVVHSDRAKVVLIEVRDVCRGLICQQWKFLQLLCTCDGDGCANRKEGR